VGTDDGVVGGGFLWLGPLVCGKEEKEASLLATAENKKRWLLRTSLIGTIIEKIYSRRAPEELHLPGAGPASVQGAA